MPRYFFDLHNDVDALDAEGKDLPDVAAAKANALKEAREMIQASVGEEGKINLHHCIQVRDETGDTIYTLQFRDAVVIITGDS